MKITEFTKKLVPAIQQIVKEELRKMLLDDEGVLSKVIKEVMNGLGAGQQVITEHRPVSNIPQPTAQPNQPLNGYYAALQESKSEMAQSGAEIRSQFFAKSGLDPGMFADTVPMKDAPQIPRDMMTSGPVIQDPGKAPNSALSGYIPYDETGTPNEAGIDLAKLGMMIKTTDQYKPK